MEIYRKTAVIKSKTHLLTTVMIWKTAILMRLTKPYVERIKRRSESKCTVRNLITQY